MGSINETGLPSSPSRSCGLAAMSRCTVLAALSTSSREKRRERERQVPELILADRVMGEVEVRQVPVAALVQLQAARGGETERAISRIYIYNTVQQRIERILYQLPAHSSTRKGQLSFSASPMCSASSFVTPQSLMSKYSSDFSCRSCDRSLKAQ